MYFFIIGVAVLFISGFFLTKTLIYFSLKHAILDEANARSSHKIATPRIGGLSFVSLISFSLAICMGGELFNLDTNIYLSLLVPSLFVASISIIDDLKGGISRLARLAFHFVAAMMTLKLLHFSAGAYEWQLVILVIALVWVINLFNFMDGIDGIAGTEALFILFASALFSFANGLNDWGKLQILICGPILGFVVLNWQPAKIFMGDIGSTFLGTLLPAALLVDVIFGALSLASAVILMGTFLSDASWTLFYRLITKQKWYHPHRSHSYQILSRKWRSHAKVSLGNGLINLLWLLPMAYLANTYPAQAYLWMAVALGPLILLCFCVKAGKLSSN